MNKFVFFCLLDICNWQLVLGVKLVFDLVFFVFFFYYKGSNVKDYIVVWVCINIIEIKDFKGVLYFGVWLVQNFNVDQWIQVRFFGVFIFKKFFIIVCIKMNNFIQFIFNIVLINMKVEKIFFFDIFDIGDFLIIIVNGILLIFFIFILLLF